MDKEQTEIRKSICEQNENINKEREIIKRNQTKIFEQKSTIIYIKNSLEGFSNKLEQTEKTISELEDRMIKSIESEGFPGGAVVKNLPANEGDTGSIPGPGRSHMPRSR